MPTFLRISAAFGSAVATYYFVYWFGGAFLDIANLPSWIAFATAVLAALFVGWYVWKQPSPLHAGLGGSVFLGAVVTGAIAFSAGFFGPMIFMPSANQGPLLGIFITGPLGVIVGAVGGAAYWAVRKRRDSASGDDPAA